MATGALDGGVSGNLLTTFGEDEEIRIDASRLLSNIPAANGIDVSTNGTVSLRIRATSADGGEVTGEIGSVEILARYTNANRYGGRDAGQGGDDWVNPAGRVDVLPR